MVQTPTKCLKFNGFKFLLNLKLVDRTCKPPPPPKKKNILLATALPCMIFFLNRAYTVKINYSDTPPPSQPKEHYPIGVFFWKR